MALSRREFLKLGSLAAATTAAASSCSVAGRELAQRELPETLFAPTPGEAVNTGDPLLRLLNRAGYGPRPGDYDRAAEMGLTAYLEAQLHPEEIEDTPAELLVRNLSYYHMDASTLIDIDEPFAAGADLLTATVQRALYSRRQLYEAMVEFWSDHFNIYIRKNMFMVYMKIVDDRDVIRPHALGNFHDLLTASAQSPAMLAYLDNVGNVKGQPNENYARELMELHTLGVDGGYTQKDVQEVARALTGWGVRRRGVRRGQFSFNPDEHDTGEKVVLGHTLPAGRGEEDVYDLLDILAHHPATAHFLATKLVRRFVADDPPAGLVEQVAAAFTDTGGEIKAMLRVLFLSDEFAAAPPKLKRPYTYMMSALRAMNADVANTGRVILHWLNLLGQPLFQWPPPNGYPDVSAAWMANLLPRWNFALALMNGGVAGMTIPFERIFAAGNTQGDPDALGLFGGLILNRPLTTNEHALFRDYISSAAEDSVERRQRAQEAAAMMLAGPAFQWT